MASEYIVTHLGDSYVVWPGLLVAGHRLGLQSITIDLLQAPASENGSRAICRSDVATLLLLAQLRAKSHALCDALNLPLKPVEDLATYVPDALAP